MDADDVAKKVKQKSPLISDISGYFDDIIIQVR